MGKFQSYMVKEGFFDCVGHGVKEGWKAFSKKRAEEKKHDKKADLSQKILTAEGEQLKQLVKQMVAQNLTVDNEGKVEDERRVERKVKATAWLSEHVRSQRRHRSSEGVQMRSGHAVEPEARELVGNSPNTDPQYRGSTEVV